MTKRKDPPAPSWPRTNARDLTGRLFGRLKVIEETAERAGNGAIMWRCTCKCGTEDVMVSTSNLTSGNTSSCGCYQGDRTRECHPAHR